MERILITAGGILGLLSVGFGAYFEHGLKAGLPPESFGSIQIGLRHQQLHGVVILVLGLACCCNRDPFIRRWIHRAGLLMITGVIIFSGSIFLTYIYGIDEFRRFAPAGGVVTMLGWMAIIAGGLRLVKSESQR